jgi:glycosyltransferase involved in cell wall biosynthesis
MAEAKQGLQSTIRVCHVASGDLWAGAESQAASLLRALARRPDLTLTVVLLNEGRLAEEVRTCGLQVKVIPEAHMTFLQILREARRYLQGRSIRILHSHRYKENLLAALLARICRIPWVVRTQHGLPEAPHDLRKYKQKFVQTLDRFVARHATDRIISVSEELRAHLLKHLDPRKVVVIPNGLDTCRVSSRLTPREAKERLGLPASCRTVGYAGRLEPVKRLDLFLAAAKLISARMPEARFLIVGAGCEANPLREIARATGLEKVVLFLGHRDDIYDVLRALDVFVLCSDHEGLPMVLLEALYLGVPVVARAVGGITDVILDGVTGILTDSSTPEPLAQACVDLLTDAERRERLSAAAVASVSEKFTADRNADQVAALYRALCGLA